jgi:hypothetical protein
MVSNWGALIEEIYGPGDARRTGRPKVSKSDTLSVRPTHKPARLSWRQELERMRRELIGDGNGNEGTTRGSARRADQEG